MENSGTGTSPAQLLFTHNKAERQANKTVGEGIRATNLPTAKGESRQGERGNARVV